MAGMFDDLIPAAKQGGGMFDDLIPAKRAAPTDTPASDIGTSLQQGLVNVADLPGRLVRMATGFAGVTPQWAMDSGAWADRKTQELQAQKSAGGQAADAATQQIITDANRPAVAAPVMAPGTAGALGIETGDVEEVQQFAFDPSKVTARGVVQAAAQSVPSMAVQYGVGRGVAGGLNRAAGVGKLPADAARAAQVKNAVVGQASTNAAMVSADTFDETFAAAKAEGLSDEEAMARAYQAAGMVAPVAAATGGVLGRATVPTRGRGFGAAAKGFLKATGAGSAEEAAEEFVQAGATNVALDKPFVTAESLNRGLVGGIVGGPFAAGAKGVEMALDRSGGQQGAVDASTVIDAEPVQQQPLALPAPRVIVNSQGQARREGEGGVYDEPPARAVGRTEQAEVVREAVREELKALGFEPSPPRAQPTPITVDRQGQARTDDQVQPRDIGVEPPARVVGRQPVEVPAPTAAPALPYDATPRASATPIQVDRDGNAALQGDTRSPDAARRQALREEAERLFPKSAPKQDAWVDQQRAADLGYEARVRELAEKSNARKRSRGVPVQSTPIDPIARETEPTSELGVVRRRNKDGSTTYLMAQQPEVELTVGGGGKSGLRAIRSISPQAQAALVRAALADGPLEAGPKTIARGVLAEVPGVQTDRFGVVRLVGSDGGRIKAEADRLAAQSARNLAGKRPAADPTLVDRAIAADPRAAVTALRQKDDGAMQAALRKIVGEPAVPDDQDVELPMAQVESDPDGVRREYGIPDDPEAIYYVTEAARDAVKQGHLSPEDFFAATRAVREGKQADAMAILRKADQSREQRRKSRVNVQANLSAATDSIPGLKKLQDEASAGDDGAATQLNRIAEDALTRLTEGIPSAKIVYSDNRGLYFGGLEPSLGLEIEFAEEDRPAVLAALAKFAENFNQQQVHVRQPTEMPVGHSFGDGSYATSVLRIELAQSMSREQVQSVIDRAGLVGMTYGPDFLEAYYVGDPANQRSLSDFAAGVRRAVESVGENARAVGEGAARLWRYGQPAFDGDNPVPYSAIAGDVRTGPAGASPTARRVAERFAGRRVDPVDQAAEITPQQRSVQESIARAYEAMPLNDLDNADVRRAYEELADEVKEQYEALPVRVEVLTGQGEPYKNSEAMRRDVLDNNHLFIFGTEAETFGPPGVTYDNHPLLADSGFKDINGRPLLMNDLLRAVHDYYAHTMAPVQFGPRGEEAAWQNHMAMTKSPWARWALTSETRGQNSWVNFRDGVDGVPVKDRPFAEQKVGLMPLEYALTGNPEVDGDMLALRDEIGPQRAGGSLKRDKDGQRVLFSRRSSSTVRMRQADELPMFEQLAPKRAALTMNWIVENPFDARRVLKLPSYRDTATITKRELGEAIDRFRTQKIDPKDFSPKAVERLATALTDEVQWYAQNAKDPGIDWYTTKFQRAVDELAKAEPSLKDETNRGIFTALLAITSDGTDVQLNVDYTMEMYRGWLEGKPFTETVPRAGQQAASYRKNAKFLDDLVADLGAERAVQFLLEALPAAEVKAEMKMIGEKSPANDYPDDAILPRAAVFLGPKLGAFYANLMGERGYLTMDRWWNRTINRYRGHMAASASEQSIDDFRDLVGNQELSDEEVILQAQVISRERQRKYDEAQAAGRRYTASKLETLATTIDKNARTELRDSPQGAADRRFQIGVVKRSQELLAERGLEANIADIQATIWYYEKDLFEKIGVKGKGRISYEEAARNWRDRHAERPAQSGAEPAAREAARVGEGGSRPEQGTLFSQGSGARQDGQAVNLNDGADDISALRAGLQRDYGRTIEVRAVEPRSDRHTVVAAAARKLFNRRVVFFASEDDAAPGGGAFVTARPGVVFINSADVHPDYILGHELLHDLRRAHPDLYQVMAKVMRERVTSPTARRDLQTESYGYTPADSVLEEENLADLAGLNFTDEKFWQRFQELTTTPQQRTFWQWAADWLAKLTDLFAGLAKRDMDTTRGLFDAAKDMRETMANVFAEASRRNKAVSSAKAENEFVVRRSYGSKGVFGQEESKASGAGRAAASVVKATAPVTKTAQAANKAVDRVGQELARVTGVKTLGEKAVAKVEGAIEAKSSWAWLERAKQGLVSDYGLPEDYLEQKIDKRSRENKLLREAKGTLDRLADMSPDQLQIAYQWLQEKPDTRRERELIGRLPGHQQAIMRAMKDDIDRLSTEAVKLGLITDETYERNAFAYVHRSYRKYEAELSTSELAARQRAQRLKGDQFKGRGMELDVSLDRLRGDIPADLKGAKIEVSEKRDEGGKLVRRDFRIAGTKALEGYAPAGTWEVRDATRKGELRIWRDFTLAERQRMGEIEDARYGFAKTMLQGVRDVETARLLRWVAVNHSKAKGDGLDVVEINQRVVQTFTRDEWVKVPDTKIPGTSVNRYGELAGRFVPGVIWNDLQGALDVPNGTWDKLLAAWKISKTALSPGVHVNNVMANFVMADLADVGVDDLRRALETIVRAKAGDDQAKRLIERYEDSGAEAGSFAANEIKVSAIEPLLKEIAKSEPEAVQRASLAQVVALAAHGNLREAAVAATKTLPGRAIGGTVETMIRAYQAEDSVFRLAKFVAEIEAGKSDQQAGKAARDAFLNYDINAPWVRAARRTVLPFISFTYRAIPLLAKAAATKPWKLAKYAALGYALNMLAYSMLGDAGDEEKEQRLLPDDRQGLSLIGLPKLLRMPWNSDDNHPMWLDIRRWIPGGDLADVTNSKSAIPLPQWLSIGGPLSLMIDFYSNTSFTGQPIVKQTDSPGQMIEKTADMLLKFALPNLPLPGLGAVLRTVGAPVDQGNLDPYSWTAIEKALQDAKTKTGNDKAVTEAVARGFGVKLESRSLADEIAAVAAKAGSQEREIRTELRKVAEQGATGQISKDEASRRMKAEIDKLVTLGRKTGEKLAPAQP